MNNSLYYRENSSIISNSIFDSSVDITAATLNRAQYTYEIYKNDTATYYLSADNGENWENVIPGAEHSFSNIGQNIKYRVDFETTSPGYREATGWIENITVSTAKSYPSNVSFDFGNDGAYDYSSSGFLNDTNGLLRTGEIYRPKEAFEFLHEELFSKL